MYILKVTWENGVTEVLRSELAAADFKATVPQVAEVEHLAYALVIVEPATKRLPARRR